MSELATTFRNYWAYGINNVQSKKSIILTKWLESGKDFQIYNPVQPTSFTIEVIERDYFLYPLASDCNRFATAAFESAIKFENVEVLPKNFSWLIVKLYYAAFYSGHFLLRILGFSFTQFNRLTLQNIETIADLFGVLNGIVIQSGFYLGEYHSRDKKIAFQKAISTGEDGSHGIMWKKFAQEILAISNAILIPGAGREVQDVSVKLAELHMNLTYMGANNGTWLSKVRNDVSYKQSHGVWFPYNASEAYFNEFDKHLNDWKFDPMKIDLTNLAGKELLRFVMTCQFIIGLARVVCIDMNQRCSIGKSYLSNSNGAVTFLRLNKL